MPEELRRWIHRHFNAVLSFLIGMTLGISILALAYFSTRNDVAAEALRHGVWITGHSDIDVRTGYIEGVVGRPVGIQIPPSAPS